MAIFGMIVGGLFALAFVADLALGIPFGRANMMMDILFSISSLMLAYMGWDAFRAAS